MEFLVSSVLQDLKLNIMLRLLSVSIIVGVVLFQAMVSDGGLDRALNASGGLINFFYWGLVEILVVLSVSAMAFVNERGDGVKKVLTTLPIPFAIAATITFLVGSLKYGGSKEEYFVVLFESMMGGAFSFLVAALLTSLGSAYQPSESSSRTKGASFSYPKTLMILSYVVIFLASFQYLRFSDVVFVGGLFDGAIFAGVWGVTFALYCLICSNQVIKDSLFQLKFDWNKFADAALYTAFIFCAFSFFEWMTIIYEQTASSEYTPTKTMGDTLAKGWLYLYWSSMLLMMAQIFLCFENDKEGSDNSFKRNWHLIELFGFFIFLTVAPPNLVDINW